LLKILKNKYNEILLMTTVYLITHLLFSYFGNGQIVGTNVIRNTIIFIVAYSLGILFWNRKKIEETESYECNKNK